MLALEKLKELLKSNKTEKEIDEEMEKTIGAIKVTDKYEVILGEDLKLETKYVEDAVIASYVVQIEQRLNKIEKILEKLLGEDLLKE